jgi:hypothetical protein
MMRRVLFSLLTCIFLLIDVSCGIDVIPVLAPPVKGDTDSFNLTFGFYSTAANGSVTEKAYFIGFELYYHFFDSATFSSISDTQLNLTTQSQMIAYGYRRVAGVSDSPTHFEKPLIAIPLDGSNNFRVGSNFTIAFSDFRLYLPVTSEISAVQYPVGSGGYDTSPVPTPPVTVPDALIYMRRSGVTNEDKPTELESFAEFQDTDPDIAGIGTAKTATLVLYVMSYGVYEFSVDLYSDAVCLGYFDVKFDSVLPK